jgi:ornithine cyclodeaminase/alanine dehydrogenase-like protein (mu-crystallin family)
MDNQKIKQILASIEEVFINENNYELRKSVQELRDENDKFLGDFVSFLMVDKKATPPIFYSVCSPYDLVSKKDPQHALVWQDGKLLLNTDYTDYAAMRTGAMDSIALKISKIDSLKDKKILLFGTGRTAKWSVRIMKAVSEDLDTINYINSTNTKSEEFESFASELGIKAIVGSKLDLKDYDIIICHTNTEEPVLSMEEISSIKSGTIITTFLGSEKAHGEVADGYYNEDANIVLDWKKNLESAKDILRSGTPESNIIFLNDLLANKVSLKDDKKYTIFRFVGTPMQNLGVLRELSINK